MRSEMDRKIKKYEGLIHNVISKRNFAKKSDALYDELYTEGLMAIYDGINRYPGWVNKKIDQGFERDSLVNEISFIHGRIKFYMLDFLRKQKIKDEREYMSDYLYNDSFAIAADEDIEKKIDNEILKKKIDQSLRGLEDEEKKIFYMTELENQSLIKVGFEMGYTKQSIHVQKKKFWRQLKNNMMVILEGQLDFSYDSAISA